MNNPIGVYANADLAQTYSYNIRSWLTAIGGTLFREEIDYETGAVPRWDGKISGIRWKNPSETAWRSFRYGYDSLSRLVSADYSGAEAESSGRRRYCQEPLRHAATLAAASSRATPLRRCSSREDTHR